MAIDLTKSLAWKQADPEQLAMLDDLQGNILKGHGRKAVILLLIRFGVDPIASRAFAKAVGAQAMSAHEQLAQAEKYKKTRKPGPVFVSLLFTQAGYAALNVTNSPKPADNSAFADGMVKRAGRLHDDPARFEPAYRDGVHALVIVGGDPDGDDKWESTPANTKAAAIVALLAGAGAVVTTERGRAIFRQEHSPAEGIEHFGYVDGRSQPLLLKEDVEREADRTDGISVWNPEFPLGQVLFPDPGSAGGKGFGSFFVFRKLEQNVRAFKAAEKAIGKTLKNGELAGATLVGRFEDGTPVVLQKTDGADDPVMNNFDYEGDPQGVRCPLHAHIRKSNPRNFRGPIMARRGITYGRRNHIVDPTDRPTGGVGLLFMAYQSNISSQFEFTQTAWVDAPGFPHQGVGIDPVIGQPGEATNNHNRVWGDPSKGTLPLQFGGHVTTLGGDYFFAPAKSTLASL